MSRINFALGALVLPLALLSTQAQPLPPEPGTAITRETAAEVTVKSGVETSGIDIRYREDQGRIK